MNTHKISFLIFAFVFSFFAVTQRAEAASCPTDWNYTPIIQVDMVSNTYWSNQGGSADLPYGVAVPFTITGQDYPPSSLFTITYPYGTSTTYPAPSPGTPRSFSIPAINEAVNGERSLNVALNPNCTFAPGEIHEGEPAPTVNLNIPIYITAPAVCSINSFTADSYSIPYNTGTTLRFSLGGGSFSWAISLLSGSTNPSPTSGVGSAGTASTNNLSGTQSYRLSCNGGQATRDVTVSVQAAPPGSIPAISSQWTANSSSNLTQVVPQSPSTQLFTIPLIFWNSGESGSMVNVTECTRQLVSGTIPLANIVPNCPQVTLTK